MILFVLQKLVGRRKDFVLDIDGLKQRLHGYANRRIVINYVNGLIIIRFIVHPSLI